MLIPYFVLGATDPEMQAIEQIARASGASIVYALGPDGRRVHPGNAYEATALSAPLAHDGAPVIAVECGGPGSARRCDTGRPPPPRRSRLRPATGGIPAGILHRAGD